MLTAVGSEEQLDASIVIDEETGEETSLVPVIGVLKSLSEFSAYQERVTTVPLACPGTVTEPSDEALTVLVRFVPELFKALKVEVAAPPEQLPSV